MQDKMPTNEKLMEMDCYLPPMCSLCNKSSESSFHLFFKCIYAFKILCWFASILNLTFTFSPLKTYEIYVIEHGPLNTKLLLNQLSLMLLTQFDFLGITLDSITKKLIGNLQ